MKDFLLNRYGDLDLSNGDLHIGYSNLQHQEHILIAQKGTLKQYPDRGVGIEDFVNESEIDEMVSEVRAEFQKDGMNVTRIKFIEETGQFDYDANYPS